MSPGQLRDLLGSVADPETPEERDVAENAIYALFREAKAQALEEAADAIDSVQVRGTAVVGPAWLRNRAEQIREGDA